MDATIKMGTLVYLSFQGCLGDQDILWMQKFFKIYIYESNLKEENTIKFELLL
jgi:hypothetical protein